MTNKEYIEKNNISFSDAMKMYDNEKYPCINDWLNQERRIGHKFKVGDFVIQSGNNSRIGIVIDVKDYVYLKFLRRDGSFERWLTNYHNTYYHNDHEVFAMYGEDKYEKIF